VNLKTGIKINKGVSARRRDGGQIPHVPDQARVLQGEKQEVSLAPVGPVGPGLDEGRQFLMPPAVMLEGLKDLVASTVGRERHRSGRLLRGENQLAIDNGGTSRDKVLKTPFWGKALRVGDKPSRP
jgi:hypothetical protein